LSTVDESEDLCIYLSFFLSELLGSGCEMKMMTTLLLAAVLAYLVVASANDHAVFYF
jgi:hypothetical protein